VATRRRASFKQVGKRDGLHKSKPKNRDGQKKRKKREKGLTRGEGHLPKVYGSGNDGGDQRGVVGQFLKNIKKTTKKKEKEKLKTEKKKKNLTPRVVFNQQP